MFKLLSSVIIALVIFLLSFALGALVFEALHKYIDAVPALFTGYVTGVGIFIFTSYLTLKYGE